MSTLVRRFWSKVSLSKSGCYLWQAAKNPAGYGVLTVRTKATRLAHHVAWFLEHGVWPKMLLHSCDTPGCVNVDHLSEGDHTRNMQEAMDRGQYPAGGEAHFNAKLSDRDVVEIRRMRQDGALNKDIAEMFGIGQSTASIIARGISRK